MVRCPVCAFNLGDPRPSSCPSCGVDFTDVPESYITKGPRKQPGTGVPLYVKILSILSVIALIIMTSIESAFGEIFPYTFRLIVYGGTIVFFIWIGLWIEKSWREMG